MNPRLKLTIVLVFAMGLLWATGANAQFLTVLNSNVPAGFGQAGYIQTATLGSDGGGTLTMNGITMIVPANSVVQFPANTLQWADLFDPAVSKPVYDTTGVPIEPNLSITCTPPALTCTGLALLDNPAQTAGLSPYLPFNANVLGNIDTKNVTGLGVDTYIVGLIMPIDQDLGNGGAGVITFIDYAKGRFEVGGQLNTPGTGTVIEINDPSGRYGWAHSPDPRWTADPDSPSVAAGNGYPMCIPRFAPPKIDFSCPLFNRPLNPSGAGQDPFLQPGAPLMVVNMPASAKPATTKPDPWKQAPFMIGDFVAYAGVMYKNDPSAHINPTKPWNQQTYISANTVGADKVALYTAPCATGTEQCTGSVGPAYLQLARMVIGTGGATPGTNVLPNANLGIIGGQIPLPEPKNNIVIVGFVTDSTQLVDVFAADIDPNNGKETDRLLGTVLPEPGVVVGGAGRGNKGRFRFEVGKGSFGNRTRLYRAESHHGMVQVPNQNRKIHPTEGGLISGQYRAPMFTFFFADAPPGFPIIPQNFDSMPFLTQGEGGNPSAGPLSPFPPFCPFSGGLPACQP
jgi:hypothetical protein